MRCKAASTLFSESATPDRTHKSWVGSRSIRDSILRTVSEWKSDSKKEASRVRTLGGGQCAAKVGHRFGAKRGWFTCENGQLTGVIDVRTHEPSQRAKPVSKSRKCSRCYPRLGPENVSRPYTSRHASRVEETHDDTTRQRRRRPRCDQRITFEATSCTEEFESTSVVQRSNRNIGSLVPRKSSFELRVVAQSRTRSALNVAPLQSASFLFEMRVL